MSSKIYEVCKCEIDKIKKDSNTISIFLVGSAKNINENSIDEDINDIDIFVFVNVGNDQDRDIKKIDGIEFDINYFSRRGFKNLVDSKEYFFLKAMKDAKIVFDRNNTASGIIDLCKSKYLEGPGKISENERCFIKSEMESNIKKLKNKEKYEEFEYYFLANLYLKELLLGYFTINNIWTPKDKNIFKELKNENKKLYNLVIQINKENVYEKMLEIYNYIFNDIVFKNHIKINY